MPYIKQNERGFLTPATLTATTAGQLNYQLTILINQYLQDKTLSYQTINDIIGALEGAKAEFQRRVVAPYEDQKIKENGDVY